MDDLCLASGDSFMCINYFIVVAIIVGGFFLILFIVAVIYLYCSDFKDAAKVQTSVKKDDAVLFEQVPQLSKSQRSNLDITTNKKDL